MNFNEIFSELEPCLGIAVYTYVMTMLIVIVDIIAHLLGYGSFLKRQYENFGNGAVVLLLWPIGASISAFLLSTFNILDEEIKQNSSLFMSVSWPLAVRQLGEKMKKNSPEPQD